MRFYKSIGLILGLFFTFSFCSAQEKNTSAQAEFFYVSNIEKKYQASEVLELYRNQKLTPIGSTLSLGLSVNDVWMVIKPGPLSPKEYMVFENAHLDTIEAFFYHANGQQIAHKSSGDRVPFNNRDIDQNYPNFKIPANTGLVLLHIRTEGAMLVPIKIFPIEKYFMYAYRSGIFHWFYFGSIFLIVTSSFIVLVWLRDNIYLYYILSTLGACIISAIDYEHTFQYLWPSFPDLNQYNIVFYSCYIFSLIFSEKLFHVKTEFPRLYKLYKAVYVLFFATILLILLTPYNTGLKIHFVVSYVIKFFSVGTAIYYFIYFKNSTSKFFLFGWVIYCISAIVYNIYVAGYLPYSSVMNNLIEIGSGIQIILFNTAILSNVSILNIKAEAEAEIRKKEITLTSVLNGMLQSVWMVDRNYKLMKWNSRFEDNIKSILNIELAQSDAGKDVIELFRRNEVDFWVPLFERVFKGESIFIEKTYPGDRYFEYYLYPIIFNGEVTAVFTISNEVTSKVRIKEAALKNEITLNSLLNSIKQSVWITDKELSIVKYNELFQKNVAEILSIGMDENLTGRKIAEVNRYDGRDEWDALYRRALNGEHIYFIKTWKEAKRTFEYNLYPININNEVSNVLILSNEITEKVKQQEALKLSEEKYKSLVENAPAAVLVYDVDKNRIVEANPQALWLFKRTKEDLMAMDPAALLPATQDNGRNSKEELCTYIGRAVDGRVMNFEWTFKNKEQRAVPSQVWLNKLPTTDACLLRATIADISERVTYQKELKELINFQSALIEKIKEHEAGLSALINSTTDYIFSLDLNLNVTEFNETFKDVVLRSFNIDLVKGMAVKNFIPANIEEKSFENFNKALTGESIRSIIETPGLDGEPVFVDIAYSPIFSDKKKVIGLTVIGRDITENKRAEKELIEINNQIVEYKLVALRSVMNPHFLFNSLNSIQFFVAKNERKLALDYLSLFSSLIRKILNSSVNNSVPLNTELEILNNYIILEKMRFEGKFDYKIEVDPEVEIDSIQIPSLLIQPYVENAILHGLMNKEDGQGYLKLKLYQQEEYLIFEVEDNGVGREKAYEIKRSRPVKEKSYGMLLTQERLDILNRTATVSVRIEDLFDAQGKAAGTKVIVSIKI